MVSYLSRWVESNHRKEPCMAPPTPRSYRQATLTNVETKRFNFLEFIHDIFEPS